MSNGLIAQLIGPDGIIIVAVLAIVLLFGGAKVPKLARGLGSASHEFRKGLSEGQVEGTEPVVGETDQPAAVRS
jgi:TatA/E family protein of Tat protein translocase